MEESHLYYLLDHMSNGNMEKFLMHRWFHWIDHQQMSKCLFMVIHVWGWVHPHRHCLLSAGFECGKLVTNKCKGKSPLISCYSSTHLAVGTIYRKCNRRAIKFSSVCLSTLSNAGIKRLVVLVCNIHSTWMIIIFVFIPHIIHNHHSIRHGYTIKIFKNACKAI